jgi:pimeloyl-ACP methyl ester carboxylesterase
MYFNAFAPGLEPLDLTDTPEFSSLLKSAARLGIVPKARVTYFSRNVVANGIRFHLLEWGEPSSPPLVLLHGGYMSAHHWDMASLALSERFHVFAIDQRGHGDSEWPRDRDLTISSMIDDTAALIRVLGLEKPMIMGHSMGGRVAMPLLAEQDVASKLVLVDIGPEAGWARGENMRSNASAWEFESVDAYVESVRAGAPGRSREQVLATMGYNLLQRVDGVLSSKSLRRNGVRTGYESDRRRVATLESMAAIRCPVLVVRGESSNMLSPDACERLLSTLRDGRVVTVPDCGHNVHTENTPGFLAAVMPFLSG